jgi:hypothetical protein
MEHRIIEFLLQYRKRLMLLALFVSVVMALGLPRLYFESDYKSFFDKSDPQLVALETLEREYTKSDSLTILLKPGSGDIFNRQMLGIVETITEQSWLAPYSIRVDSLTNFQHSRASGDDLFVDALVPDAASLTNEDLARIKHVALNEIELVNRIVSIDGSTTTININIELPPRDRNADAETQAAQRVVRESAFTELHYFVTELTAPIKLEHPDLEIHLLGLAAANYTVGSSSEADLNGLIPTMYLMIAVALAIIFRSVASVIGCLLIIGAATLGGMGMAGWLGYTVNPVMAITPVIILTIAVCDAVHLIVLYHRHLSRGESRLEAMRESLTVNLQPIVLTSVTTAVGFLTLNFCESPLYRSLGNVSSIGVMLAMTVSLTMLPAFIIATVGRSHYKASSESAVMAVGRFIVRHAKMVLLLATLSALALVSQITRNHSNNDVMNYFKPGVPFKDAALFANQHLPGVKIIGFSLDCGSANCINEPEYLQTLETFARWLETQPAVEYATSYTDVLKRLNRNMHGDEPQWYALPENRELAAQYQLLYELSLPYGLDMNNIVNFDKSATRMNIWLEQITTSELLAAEQNAVDWLQQHAPTLLGRGASVDMMFASQFVRDMRSMSWGGLFAMIGITATILIATRSLKHGMLSIIPNVFPAAMALGVWGLIVGEVNSIVVTVFSITLGLVVDNTVHFISKYRRAMEKNLGTEAAIQYAFSRVGNALMVTAIVLSLGFGLLTTSNFMMNAYMGGMTAITIIIALVFDILMLPALLMRFDYKPAAIIQASADAKNAS